MDSSVGASLLAMEHLQTTTHRLQGKLLQSVREVQEARGKCPPNSSCIMILLTSAATEGRPVSIT